MRVLIVDDETPARELLKEYLAGFQEADLVGECGSGREAVDLIQRLQPDLVFLDVQMPGLTGFEVLEQLGEWPYVIFCTAYDHYALRAFEVNAVDYLLKPFTRERFAAAFGRAAERKRMAPADFDRIIRLLQETHRREENPERLFVRIGEKIVPVAVEDITWIEALGDYSRLHTPDGIYVCGLGIGALESRLDSVRFVRVHRSTIIAVEALRQLTPDGDGGYVAELEDGTKVRVSRSYAAEIRRRVL